MEEQEVKTSKIKKLKKHVRENKEKYIYLTTGVVAGVIGTLVYCLKTGKFSDVNINDGVSVQGETVEIGNIIYQKTISRHGFDIGRPGMPVIDLTTGEGYMSCALVAKDLGASPSQVSDHLHGRRAHVNGHTLKLVGDIIREFEENNQ